MQGRTPSFSNIDQLISQKRHCIDIMYSRKSHILTWFFKIFVIRYPQDLPYLSPMSFLYTQGNV
ncbi:MAG TPA: hypothetical protein DD706_14400 [Nitrospiraceae bacterium]|nr:hypothetical protein [Nitrospiraceae bacterium]